MAVVSGSLDIAGYALVCNWYQKPQCTALLLPMLSEQVGPETWSRYVYLEISCTGVALFLDSSCLRLNVVCPGTFSSLPTAGKFLKACLVGGASKS